MPPPNSSPWPSEPRGKAGAGAFERALLTAVGLLAPALIWEVLARTGFLDRQFIPSFLEALGGIAGAAQAGLLPGSLIISLWRATMGFLAAALCAVPLGLLIGRAPVDFGACCTPLFRLLAQVNPFTLAPLFILWFGIGEGAKVAITGWVSFWPVLFNTLQGARAVDPLLLKTARALGASGLVRLFTVVLPAAAPAIFSGLRGGLGMAFFVLVAAEMIGASSGIGWLVQASYWNLRFPWMYGAIILAVVMGLCMGAWLNRLSGRLFFWREGGAVPALSGAKPLTGGSLVAVAVVLLLIFLGGLWQIRETEKGWQRFGKEGYTAPGIGIFDD